MYAPQNPYLGVGSAPHIIIETNDMDPRSFTIN